MKWIPPKDGQRRIKRKFAWLPVKTQEGTKIWLEFYYALQEYGHNPYNPFRSWEWTDYQRTQIIEMVNMWYTNITKGNV